MSDADAPSTPVISPEPADRRAAPPTPLDRVLSLVEVTVCSGFPTQLLILVVLHLAGQSPTDADGRLRPVFIAMLSLADAMLVVGLVALFVVRRGESMRELLLGRRPAAREAALGAALVPPVLLGVVALVLGLRLLAPSLHNVPRNPLEDLLQRPGDVWLFSLVLVVAGGLREEVQRAFILRRFERELGGALVGLVLFSLVFGAGHLDQGRDVAITTAVLGGFWGGLYLARRSIVATAVSHAGFNLSEIARYVLLREA